MYRGVSLKPSTGGWVAQISVNGKRIHLGHYKSEKMAALAYDKAVIKFHGKYGFTNFYRNKRVRIVITEAKEKP